MRFVPVLLLLLAGCVDPAAQAPSAPDAPEAPPALAEVGEPWLLWLGGCGHCHAGDRTEGLLVMHDGRALWWTHGHAQRDGPGPTLRMPHDHPLRPAMEEVHAHLAALLDAPLAWRVDEALVVGLGDWDRLAAALAQNESAARAHGTPEHPGCHDCTGTPVVLWPDGLGVVVEGYDRPGWSGLSGLLGRVAQGLGPHQEAS